MIQDFIAAQAEFTEVSKSKQGYGYKYAPLDEVLKMARPILVKNGFMLTQDSNTYVDDNGVEWIKVYTKLIHISGEYMENVVRSKYIDLKQMNAYQSLGSAITYLRRYGLSMILGIASDEDTDAQGEQSKNNNKQKQQPKPKATKEQVLKLEELSSKLNNKDKMIEKYGKFDLLDITTAAKLIAALEKKIKEAENATKEKDE